MMFIKCVLWTCCLVTFVTSQQADAPEVQITQGILRGNYMVSRNGRQFSSFTSIPYAKPPVGALRFEVAQPAAPWDGVLDATQIHEACPQSLLLLGGSSAVFGSEDCLYLNVYTPQAKNCTEHLLPVMIFIPGGAFAVGNASYYDPRNLLDKEIVVVVPSYRLGPLGFLATGDAVVPGNNGLKDQSLAIRWVKGNIQQFGGNPEEITLFGQDAGGISTLHHMVSPLSRDLIKGIISQSPVLVWGLSPNDQAQRHSRQLAQSLNCSTNTSEEMVRCLKTVNASDITSGQDQFAQWSNEPIAPFKPVIEPNLVGAFLPEDPVDIIKAGQAAKIPLMIGITTQEGALKTPKTPEDLNALNENFDLIVPLTVQYQETASDVDYITHQLREYYFGGSEIANSSIANATDMYTDGMFLTPINNLVELHVNYTAQPVYYYTLGYRSGVSYTQILGDPYNNYGVCHDDDILYIFGFEATFPSYQPNVTDERVTDIMIDLWVNFATSGNPTPEPTTLIPTKWEPVQSENLEFFFIRNDTDITMSEKLYWERYQFWKTLPLGTWIF